MLPAFFVQRYASWLGEPTDAGSLDLAMPIKQVRLSIIIPTYGREQVLVDTLDSLLGYAKQDCEVILVDQTATHEPEVHTRLEYWSQQEAICWLRQTVPSIPMAMNRGASEAKGELLLFLDDDIVPDSHLHIAHILAQESHRGDIIAGRVLQPWHEDSHDSDPFTKATAEIKEEFMGGNFSIRREKLFSLGGFDENFKGAAYRFEREFSDRILATGGTIWYEPTALIRHLHYQSGGTRSKGDHLTSWNPRHPVGAYYYLFVSPRVRQRMAATLMRLASSVLTRHHLRKPWYIPVTITSELQGLLWALWLRLKGPALPFRESGAKD